MIVRLYLYITYYFMNFFNVLYTQLITRPILNLLVIFLVLSWWNLWISIVLLTIIVRLLLLSTTWSANTMGKHMTDMWPKMQELQEKYKDDPETLSKETMKLLKTQWAWPLKWCVWLLVQIPVFLGLLHVIQNMANWELKEWLIYSFLDKIGSGYLDVNNINHMFLGMDLLQPNNIILTIIAGLLIYLQTTMMSWVQPKPAASSQTLPNGQAMPDMSKMMPFMNIMMVVMMWSFVYSVKSGVWLYILVSTLVWLLQLVRQYRIVLRAKFWLLPHHEVVK